MKLDDKRLEELLKPILEIYTEVEKELLIKIISMIGVYDSIGGSLEWWIKKLDEMGLLNDYAIKLFTEASKKSFSQLKKSINELGYGSIDYDTYNVAYELGATLINPRNISLNQVINSAYNELTQDMKLVHSNAIQGASKTYMRVINKAHLETTTGLYDYETSIKRALESMGEEGIIAATYLRDGKEVNYSIEGVVRRHVISGMVDVANKASEEVAIQLEAEYVAVSEHLGARHKGEGHQNHESWQGKAYKRVGEDENYLNFIEVTGYGLVDGLGGVYCRHIYFAYFPDISPLIQKTVSSEENNRIADLKDRQRLLERRIRADKRKIVVAEELGDEDMIINNQKLLKKHQEKLANHIDDNPELRRESSKEQITRVKVKPDEHIVGRLDISKGISDYDIATDEIVLLPERVRHIVGKHPGVIKSYKKDINRNINNPEYILKDKNINTINYINQYDDSFLVTVVKINTNKNSNYKNSIITMYTTKQKSINKKVRNQEVLFDKMKNK